LGNRMFVRSVGIITILRHILLRKQGRHTYAETYQTVQVFCFWTLSIFLVFIYRTQRFGDWILSPSSGKKPTGMQDICWKEEKVLQIEPNSTYRKYKESSHISLLDHPISQPSLDISPIWTPILTAKVRKLQLRPVKKIVFLCWYHAENLSL
jgi:hypothetical protein